MRSVNDQRSIQKKARRQRSGSFSFKLKMDDLNDLVWSSVPQSSQPIPSLQQSFNATSLPKGSPLKHKDESAFEGLVSFTRKPTLNQQSQKASLASTPPASTAAFFPRQDSQKNPSSIGGSNGHSAPSTQPTSSLDGKSLDAFFSPSKNSSAPSTVPTQQNASTSSASPWDLDFLQDATVPSKHVASPMVSSKSTLIPVKPAVDIFDLGFLEAQPPPVVAPAVNAQKPQALVINSVKTLPSDTLDSAVDSPISPDQNSPTTHTDKDIARLMAAGFEAEEARIALDATDGNIEKAVDLLFENRQALKQESFASSPIHDKITFWEKHKVTPQEKVVATASAIGISVFKSAKSAFDYSKKKISEAVEKAQERFQETPQRRDIFDKPSRDSPQNHFTPYRDADSEPPARVVQHKRPDPSTSFQDKKPHSTTFSNPEAPFADNPPALSRSMTTPKPLPSRIHQQPVAKSNSLSNDPMMEKMIDFNAAPLIAPSASAQGIVQPKAPPISVKQAQPIVTATSEQLSQSAAHKEQGNTFFKGGLYAEAETCYTLAIQCLPENHASLAPLYNNRAGARLKIGGYAEAVLDCNKVQELEPMEIKSLLRRANAFEGMEKWEEAQADYRKILVIDPNVKSVSQGLARCAKALKPSEPAPADPSFDSGFGNAKTTKAPTSGMADFASFIQPAPRYTTLSLGLTPLSQASTHVQKAVDSAVQSLREKNQQIENEDALKLALKDKTDDRV